MIQVFPYQNSSYLSEKNSSQNHRNPVAQNLFVHLGKNLFNRSQHRRNIFVSLSSVVKQLKIKQNVIFWLG